MDPAERADLIERYRSGYQEVIDALAGATAADLDARPADGWSPREVVHHLADSEMTSAIRLRKLLAEEDPIIVGYDESEYARRLHYADRPIEPSLDALRAARATTVQLLERLTEGDWQRSGTHTESGPYSVERWLEIYGRHCHEHADQIRAARGAAAG
jgi:hypothetical protein